MKLITEEIKKSLPPLYTHSDAGTRPENVPVVVKYFNPVGNGTWYITEGCLQSGNLFGLCDLGMGYPELGYVSLQELEGYRGLFGLGIERDLHLPSGFTLADAMERVGY